MANLDFLPPLITTRPSVTITTDALNLAGNTFVATFTFTQAVSGFSAAKVTAINATVGTVSTSNNIVYTSTITTTSIDDSPVVLRIISGVCTNSIGIYNNESNTLTQEVEPYAYRLFDTNLVFAPTPWFATTVMQESNLDGTTNYANTAVVVNNSVGTIYDVSSNMTRTFAANNSRRPVLQPSGALRFTAASTQYLAVDSSTELFNYLCAASPVGTIYFEFDASLLTDGVQYFAFDSVKNGSTANSGIELSRTTANKLLWLSYKASAGNNVAQYTTTTTVVASNNTCSIRIVMNGTGASAGTIQIVKNKGESGEATVTETFLINAGVNNLVQESGLLFGTKNALSNYWNSTLNKIVFTNNIWSAGQISGWKAYAPSYNSSSKIYRVFKQFDLSAGKTWQDTAKAAAASSDGDRVRILEPILPATNAGSLQRSWISPSFYLDIDGTSGAGNLNVDGVNYVVTYAVSGTVDADGSGKRRAQTAINFVTTQNAGGAGTLFNANWYCEYQKNVNGGILGRITVRRIRPGLAEPASLPTFTNTSGDISGTVSDTKRGTLRIINGQKVIQFENLSKFTNYFNQNVTGQYGGRHVSFSIRKFTVVNAGGHAYTAAQAVETRDVDVGDTYAGNPKFPNGNYNVFHLGGTYSSDDLAINWNQFNLTTTVIDGLTVRRFINGVEGTVITLPSNPGADSRKLQMGGPVDGDSLGATNQYIGYQIPEVVYQGQLPDVAITALNTQFMAIVNTLNS